MDLRAAASFIRQHGGLVELARLDYALEKRLAGFHPTASFLQTAADRLDALQAEGGYWPGEGGPQQDLHTTLEALRVLHWLNR